MREKIALIRLDFSRYVRHVQAGLDIPTDNAAGFTRPRISTAHRIARYEMGRLASEHRRARRYLWPCRANPI